MNRRILSLALPNIVTNITVPLLGMVDMAVVGHLSPAHIGAITIGSSIFNLIYWNFGFLRMGTSGMTAQAYGAGRMDEAASILTRACVVALAIAAMLLLLQWPISLLAQMLFEGGAEVMGMAMTYFFIRIWAAPATLGLYAIKGWFIGMQNSRVPMWIAIALNIVNIVCSLLFVLVLHWDIAGVALGTVIAQYSGLAMGILFLRKAFNNQKIPITHTSIKELLKSSLHWHELKSFFKLNGDIFLRTVCLASVFTFITAASGRISDEVLAIDALLLQFFTLFSYIMDGFAYAGESLVGRYIGARDPSNLRLAVRWLTVWGVTLTVLFGALYASFGKQFLHIFSNDEALIAATSQYMVWVVVVPVCGFAAFLFDGIFVGATAGRTMRNAMFVATAAFFALYFGFKELLVHTSQLNDSNLNNALWLSFMVYLSLRGILQAARLRRDVYSRAEATD
ncbi:MAG: MATE family efflux transporter [Bacteroidales bacterium]|nr:MATE family efflux transporter [Bacteroidales bacterium]